MEQGGHVIIYFFVISLGVGRDKALQIERYHGSDKHKKHKIQRERSGALRSEEDFEDIEGDFCKTFRRI